MFGNRRFGMAIMLMAVMLSACFAVPVRADNYPDNHIRQYSLASDTTNKSLAGEALGQIKKTVRGFSAIDTNYIEPQHYH